MKPTLPFACLLFASTLLAQNSPFYYPISGQSAALRCIETYDGRIALAGWHETGESGRQALLLILTDSTKNQPMWHHAFGGGYDDEARALLEMPDGSILLTGKAGRKGGYSAWLLNTNRAGEILWQWNDPDEQRNSAFHDVVLLANGTVAAAGEKDGRAFVCIIKPERGAKPLTWHGANKGAAHAITNGPMRRVAITGYTESPRPEIFVLELDTLLVKVGNPRTYGLPSPGSFGSDISYDADNRRYIVTVGNEPHLEITKAQFLYTTSASLMAFDPFKNQRHKNTAHSVLPLPGGRWLMVGATNNMGDQPGAFRPVRHDSDLKNKTDVLLRDAVFQGIDEGVIYSAVLTHNGSVWVVGEGRAKRSAQMRAFAHQVLREKLPPAAGRLSVEKVSFEEANGNDTLNAYEAAYIGITIKKSDNRPLWGLRANIRLSGNTWGVGHERRVYFDHLLHDTAALDLHVPIWGESYLASGQTSATILVEDAFGNKLTDDFHLTFNTKADPSPNLTIHFVTRDSVLIPREQEVPVQVCVRNTGEGIARAVQLQLNPPYLVQVLDPALPIRDTLLPGDSLCYTVRLKVSFLYLEDWFYLNAKASESSNYYKSVAYKQLTVRTTSYYEMTPKGEQKPIRLESIEEKMSKGGPNPPDDLSNDKVEKNGFTVEWSYLSDPIESAEYQVKKAKKDTFLANYRSPELILKGRVQPLAGEKLDTAFFRRNLRFSWTKVVSDEKKTYESALCDAITEFADSLHVNGEYFFYKKVDLAEGENGFVVTVFKNGKEEGRSRSFNIKYNPPAIHCFFIGIPDTNTEQESRPKNMQRNAAIIKDLFEDILLKGHLNAQKGNMFFDTTAEGTTCRELGNNIGIHAKKINSEDHLLVFISGHGLLDRVGSELVFNLEFSSGRENCGFVFGKEFISLNNQRTYFFLDACHSGSMQLPPVESTQKDTSNEVLAMPRSHFMFASTGAQQRAYELDSLSIFATALSEVLQSPQKADYDNNGVLTIVELDSFLHVRVSELVAHLQNRKEEMLRYKKVPINQQYPKSVVSTKWPITFLRYK